MKKAVNQVEEMRVVLPKSSNRHDGVVIGKNMGITHIMLCPIIAKILLLMPKKLTKTLNNLGLKNEFFYKKLSSGILYSNIFIILYTLILSFFASLKYLVLKGYGFIFYG